MCSTPELSGRNRDRSHTVPASEGAVTSPQGRRRQLRQPGTGALGSQLAGCPVPPSGARRETSDVTPLRSASTRRSTRWLRSSPAGWLRTTPSRRSDCSVATTSNCARVNCSMPATPMINPRRPNARRHAQVRSHQSQQSHPSRDPMRWLLGGGVQVGKSGLERCALLIVHVVVSFHVWSPFPLRVRVRVTPSTLLAWWGHSRSRSRRRRSGRPPVRVRSGRPAGDPAGGSRRILGAGIHSRACR